MSKRQQLVLLTFTTTAGTTSAVSGVKIHYSARLTSMWTVNSSLICSPIDVLIRPSETAGWMKQESGANY